ncbi:MAG: hypothetical protein EZS28_020943 [Streblomastix strix]|uniref:SPRY domain-containing protein n=1 Tax=Streblomastix strix TaxID=222440 RepID=A0A5J4VLR6_9EUKA|nr:MAG: hypothetical protein EZS28_020943 [Streblomastix strix]
MDHASEYNVIGSLLGLGPDILLELISEMKLPKEVQLFLVVCKKFFKLKDHPRFAKIIYSITQITPAFVINQPIIGIADASCSFAAGSFPTDGENRAKTVRYWSDGDISHINTVKGNQRYKDGQRISAIVDMTSNPRKVVFYIDDIEQPNFVIGIPSEIRFWAYTYYKSSSFTVTKLERLVQFNSQIVPGSKAHEW